MKISAHLHQLRTFKSGGAITDMVAASPIQMFLFFLQFHNKVTCFMLHQIEEPCSLGAHAGVIVPPSWIIKVRKPQVRTHTQPRRNKVQPLSLSERNEK